MWIGPETKMLKHTAHPSTPASIPVSVPAAAPAVVVPVCPECWLGVCERYCGRLIDSFLEGRIISSVQSAASGTSAVMPPKVSEPDKSRTFQ